MERHKPIDKQQDQDAAWAVLHTPLSTGELMQFCQDIERLFRINPMLNFKKWQALEANRYFFSGQNISQEPPFDFESILSVTQLPDGIQIDYDQGLKTRTTFTVTPAVDQPGCRSRLTIKDYYDGLPENERAQQLHLVDKSITNWANDLQRYLMIWQKWSPYPPWRWYMRHIWLSMKPMGRRISYILFWIAFFEVILILLGAAIYYLEYTE